MDERRVIEKTIRPDGSNERIEICLGGVVHVLSLEKGEQIARETLSLLGINVEQLEAELRIEKQKHLDTSNWTLEQQDRADKAEAENERLLKYQDAYDAMLIECLDVEATKGSIMVVGRQALGNERITNLQDRIFEWGRKTFGPGQRSGGVFAHLAREIKELGESLPKIDPDELADCTILLFELAGFANVQLLDEVEKKFEINQTREWGPIEADGSILHIESGGES